MFKVLRVVLGDIATKIRKTPRNCPDSHSPAQRRQHVCADRGGAQYVDSEGETRCLYFKFGIWAFLLALQPR